MLKQIKLDFSTWVKVVKVLGFSKGVIEGTISSAQLIPIQELRTVLKDSLSEIEKTQKEIMAEAHYD